MTYPLPTLTWEMSEQETFSSPTIFDILTSLNNIFTSASYWEVKNSSLASTGSSDNYLEVGPITSASASYADQRIIFAGGANPNTMASYYTQVSDRLMINFCPDITNRTQTAADWKTADPFDGADIPGTGFVQLGTSYSSMSRIHAITCQEGVILNLRRGIGNNTAYPFMAGALVDPGHSNGGDANNRRWILASQGGGTTYSPFGTWNSSTHAAIPQTSANFFLKNTSTTSNYPHAFVLKTSTNSWDSNVVCDTAHDIEATLSSFRDILDDQGYLVLPSTRVVSGNPKSSPSLMYGFLRQIYFCINARDRESGQSSDGENIFFVWGPVQDEASSPADSFMVTNFS